MLTKSRVVSPVSSPVRVAPRISRNVVRKYKENETSVSVETLVKADHDKVRNLFQQFKSGGQDKQRIAWEIIRELSMHSIKEEESLYPAIKQAFGDDEYKHFLAEHAELKKLLVDLDGMSYEKDPSKYETQLMEVEKVFQQHIKEEENTELPKLLKADGIDPVRIANEFQRAAEHAPTRPHILAPDKAPINTITNAATQPLDAARDAIQRPGLGKDNQ